MKVVLDTNVVVSALLKPLSKPSKILRLVLQGTLDIVVNEHILTEYLQVLTRPSFGFRLQDVERILEFIRSKGTYAPALSNTVFLPDRGDEPFLEAALAARADALITGNKRHFPRQARRGLRVLTPDEFLRKMLG